MRAPPKVLLRKNVPINLPRPKRTQQEKNRAKRKRQKENKG